MTSEKTIDDRTLLSVAATPLRRAMGCVFVASLLFLSVAHANEASDARIERMTDAIVEMSDFGAQMDKSAAEDPMWPVKGASDKFAPEEIACLRDQLSTTGYRRSKRADVVAYAAANSGRFERDVESLESIAPIFAAIREKNSADDFEAFMSKMSAERMLAFRVHRRRGACIAAKAGRIQREGAPPDGQHTFRGRRFRRTEERRNLDAQSHGSVFDPILKIVLALPSGGTARRPHLASRMIRSLRE